MSSTAVENIGLLTRSKTPLTSNAPADKITNVFTTTELADDSKRARCPWPRTSVRHSQSALLWTLSGKDKSTSPSQQMR